MNKAINGDFRIDQINEGSAVTANAAIVADGWRGYLTGVSGVSYSAQRRASSDFPGFMHSLRYTFAGTPSNPNSNGFSSVGLGIAGRDMEDLCWGTANAQPLTVSFFCKSNYAGTIGLGVRNGMKNRSFVIPVQINAANTVEEKIIQIPGDITGTWIAGPGLGVMFNFDFGIGPDYCANPWVWQTADGSGLPGGMKLCAQAGAFFEFTGFQVLAGIKPIPFAPEPYALAQTRCNEQLQVRKYPSGSIISTGVSVTTTDAEADISFQEMRGVPVITLPACGASAGQATFLKSNGAMPTTHGGLTTSAVSAHSAKVVGSGFTGLTAAGPSELWAGADAKIILDATFDASA